LLIPGDAEFVSWQQIFEACKKGQHSISAHFLKVSHHGSHNGTSNIIAKKSFNLIPKTVTLQLFQLFQEFMEKKMKFPQKR
jgi:hypothetical protein